MTTPEAPEETDAPVSMQRIAFRRQHPVMIVFQFFLGLRDLFLYFVFISLFKEGLSSTIFVVGILSILVFASTVLSALRWYSYRYRLSPNGILEVHSGIFQKKRRTLSRNSVQALDIEQGILHKIFRVVRVRIDTAGGAEGGEVEFTAILRKEAERINTVLKGNSDAVSDLHERNRTTSENAPLYQASFGTLLTYALTSGKVGFIFPFLFAALTELPEEFVAMIVRSVSDVVQSYSTRLFGGSGPFLILIFSIVVLFLSWILSTAMTVLTYASFRISRDGDELKTSYGLLKSYQTSIPVRQVKSIALRENRLRIPFSLVSVFVEVNRGRGKHANESILLLPIVHKHELQTLIQQILPDFPAYSLSVEGPPLRSLHRYFFRYLLMGALILWALYGIYLRSFPLEEILPLFGALLPGFLFYGYLQWRYSGISFSTETMTLRRGGFNIRSSIVPKRAAQSMVLSSHPLQRHSKLCNITVYLTIGRSARVLRHIDNRLAERCMRWLPRQQLSREEPQGFKNAHYPATDPGLAQ